MKTLMAFLIFISLGCSSVYAALSSDEKNDLLADLLIQEFKQYGTDDAAIKQNVVILLQNLPEQTRDVILNIKAQQRLTTLQESLSQQESIVDIISTQVDTLQEVVGP